MTYKSWVISFVPHSCLGLNADFTMEQATGRHCLRSNKTGRSLNKELLVYYTTDRQKHSPISPAPEAKAKYYSIENGLSTIHQSTPNVCTRGQKQIFGFGDSLPRHYTFEKIIAGHILFANNFRDQFQARVPKWGPRKLGLIEWELFTTSRIKGKRVN